MAKESANGRDSSLVNITPFLRIKSATEGLDGVKLSQSTSPDDNFIENHK